jgi:hypothetical protein
MPTLTLQSSPQLNLPRPIRLTMSAHPRLATQSATVSLPPAHHALHIAPHLPVALQQRPYRLFVSVNGRPALRLGTTESDRSRPVFEGRLERGVVNRVEVEVLAASEGGKGVEKGKEGVEWEKMSAFVYLPRVA